MSKIQAELAEATELKKKATESEQDFKKRIVRAVSDLDDAEWEKLSEPAQNWFNEAADLLNQKKDLPDFPDAEKPAGRTRAKKDADEAPAKGKAKDEDEASADPAVGDVVTITTKRGKVSEGKVVEIDDTTLVVETDGEEVEFDRGRLESVVVKADEKPATKSRRKSAEDEEEQAPAVAEPAVGDQIVAITGKGKEVKGKVIELEDDLIVVDDGTDELELVPSKLKSLTIVKDEAPAKGKRKSADADEAPAAGKGKAKDEDPKPKRATAKENGGVSATGRMRELICEDPNLSKEDLSKQLKKEGLQFRDNTLDLVYADVQKIISILKGMKKLK